MNPHPPKVTVLMPVYNGETYLGEAVESILNQTYTDFEFLIINDGSTDRSAEIIHSYSDSRIRLVHNDTNIGLVATLNGGINLSKGQYIARMDCDDISLPERLAKQVAFMDAHPDVGISGTWMRHFGTKRGKTFFLPTDHENIKCGLLFHTVLAHPSIIMRKTVLIEKNLYYDREYLDAEDYELLVRSLRYITLNNLGEILLLYRLHDTQVGHRHNESQLMSARKIWKIQLSYLNITPTDDELDVHQAVSTGLLGEDSRFLSKVEKWLYLLMSANKKLQVYSGTSFEYLILERWIKCCYRVYGFSASFFSQFFMSLIVKDAEYKYKGITKLFLTTSIQRVGSRFYPYFRIPSLW